MIKNRNDCLNNILNYYIAACYYVLNKLPIENAVQKHAIVGKFNFIRYGDFTFSPIKSFFLDLFACLLKVKPDQV